MKKWKRIAGVLLAMVMVLGLGITAMATEGGGSTSSGNGSITIENAVKGQTYTIYRVFDLEVDNPNEPTAYKYTLNEKWSDLDSYSAEIDGKTVNASSFFTVDTTDKHIVWGKNDDTASFAKLLNAYQQANGIAKDGSEAAEGSTITFKDLPLGYYFVQSGLGSVCSLDTTKPDATIVEKNSAPTVDKKVQEDSTEDYGETNTADIGDTVNFQTTINVLDGNPQGYVLHDEMSEGLSFGTITSVTVNDEKINEGATGDGTAYYTYTSSNDDCTFELSFTNLKPNDVIVVSYTATVNENAVIGSTGNDNKTWLNYSDKTGTTQNTTTEQTKTFVFDVDILKYTTGDDGITQIPLEGAEFVLYKTVDGINYYAKVTGGKLDEWTKTKDEATTLTSGENGKISVKGLDADTYYLEETKAPEGYNLLDAPVTIVIEESGEVKMNDTEVTTVEIENMTGTALPSTGGIGTTIFYVAGGILVAGVCVVMVMRKRRLHV